MKMEMKIALVCPLCGTTDDEKHADDCLIGILKTFQKTIINTTCPLCGGSTTVNQDDFFECRKCHTQFCRSNIVDSPNPEHSVLQIRGQLVAVNVLVQKGKGNFHKDKHLEKLQEQVEAALKEKDRLDYLYEME